MSLSRFAPLLALLALVAALGDAAAGAPSRPYELAATEACLLGLPSSVSGLPPATPPAAPALFVHRSQRDRIDPHAKGGLSLFRGSGKDYVGVRLLFFASANAAQTYREEAGGGAVVDNALLTRDGSAADLARTARRCLVATAPAKYPRHRAPRASLATFAGGWGGHTRGLTVSRTGVALESTNDGCCSRLYSLRFRIVSVTGTITHARATYRVTSFTPGDLRLPGVRPGRIGTLILADGIVTNTLTRVFFCSDPAWGETGACGA